MKIYSNTSGGILTKKAVPVVAILLVIILFSGCIQKEVQPKETGVTDAIAVEFTPGAPPDQILEQEAFEVSVKIENEGEHPLSADSIYVVLSGANPSSLGQDADYFHNTNEYELIGAREIDNTKIPGGLEILDWTGLKYIVDISSDHRLKFVAQACYNYQTTATADVCLSSNPYAQTTGAETCTAQGEKKTANTGSPVKVTKLVENPAGRDKYTFTFTIENKGKGEVYALDVAKENCAELQLKDLDKVKVTSFSIGQEAYPDCEKEVRLVDGKGQFFCTASVDNIAGDYLDLLTLKLEYGYRSHTSKEVTIKNVYDEYSTFEEAEDNISAIS